jgi:nucleotide-binding universal stress UspA family protein
VPALAESAGPAIRSRRPRRFDCHPNPGTVQELPMTDPRRILLHVDRSPSMAQRYRTALELAERFDARTDAQYAVTPAIVAAPGGLGASPVASSVAAAAMLRLDEDRQQAAKATFDSAAAGSSRLRWVDARGDAFESLVRRARYADLVLLGQPDPGGGQAGEQPGSLIPDLLAQSGRPALVLPHAGNGGPIGGRVLVAWTPSPEATRALAAAMPWLRRSRAVDLVSFGPRAVHELDDLADYLGTHAIDCTARPGPQTDAIGEYLLSEASDRGSDLLVMGCYGHSRMRERFLGGATRTILESMTLPVLMMH